MDQGTGDSLQRWPTPLIDNIAIKLDLPWTMKEEPQDQPSAVDSTVQSMSDNTSGSLLSLNTSHVCQRCSAVFVLPSSLQVHMETFHGETLHSELPVASGLNDSSSEDTDKLQTPSGQERSSTQKAEYSGEDSVTSSDHFVIKLESPWSMKEEPQDQSSAVNSTVQPMSDSTSGSLLSLTTSHVCQRCSATFALFSSLELHMVTFHGETLHDWFPMHSAYDSSGVGYHHDSGTETVGNCNSKEAAKRRNEKQTNKTIQERKSRQYVCDICNDAFTRADHLKVHKLIHTSHKMFICDVCSKAFTQVGALNRHKLIHAGLKPFACDVCSKAFTLAGNLNRHKMIHSGQKPFVCDVCSKAFTAAGDLGRHKMTHSGHKPFVCDMCGKAFKRADFLKTHRAVRTEERPCKCPHCDAQFNVACHLQLHIRTLHAAHRCHVCGVCGFGFPKSCQLRQHMRIHTGERPYVCTECGKGFTQSSVLKNHQRTHTGEKPHTCPLCPATFTQSGHLKKHLRKSHQ